MKLIFKSLKSKAIYYWDGKTPDQVFCVDCETKPIMKHNMFRMAGTDFEKVILEKKREFFRGMDKYIVLYKTEL